MMLDIRVLTRLALLLAVLSLAGCGPRPLGEAEKTMSMRVVASKARQAVERQTGADLSTIGWEVAGVYRMSRLMYRENLEYFKVTLGDKAISRELAEQSASLDADTVLGLYKRNLRKVFVNTYRLDEISSADRLQRYMKKACSEYGRRCGDLQFRNGWISEGQARKQLAMALFIHEYSHAAADLQNLIRFPERYSPGVSEVTHVINEGYAEYMTEKICQHAGCELGYLYLADYSSSLEHARDDDERHYLEVELKIRQFTYGQGQRIVEHLVGLEDQLDRLKSFLARRPSSLFRLSAGNEESGYPQSETVRMLTLLGHLQAALLQKGWVAQKNVLYPAESEYLTRLLLGNGWQRDASGPNQAVVLRLNRMDLFSLYQGESETAGQYLLLKDFGSSERAKAAAEQGRNLLLKNVAGQSVRPGVAAAVQRQDDWISLVQIDRYLLLAKSQLNLLGTPELAGLERLIKTDPPEGGSAGFSHFRQLD